MTPGVGSSAKKSAKKLGAKTEKRLELVFEIGCEEIPAGMLPRAADELRTNITKLLTAENLMEGVTVETFSGPRRLTAWVRGLIAKQEDVTNDVTGPPISVAFDKAGAPTRAALSFAEKQGVRIEDLHRIQTPKGEYLAARQVRRGRTAEEILSEILPRTIHDLTWPRSMTWTGIDGARFIRPIRWLLAVLAERPLKFSYGGVTSGDKTFGHRFIGRGELTVRNFEEYEKKLGANGVIVRPEARREKIERELAQIARKGGFQIHEDAALENLVCYLNEHPTLIEGEFDSEFLNLPDEILVTVMRDHQKYFAVENSRGELAPKFLA
ncbi:MAG TPA: glycine--tRNA ligase subunit beta, partial [Candidatus Acidoferrum sp.]|nr:glycine--tRNA ligase subunit beta [Candidatus Acidoferrum sp.]